MGHVSVPVLAALAWPTVARAPFAGRGGRAEAEGGRAVLESHVARGVTFGLGEASNVSWVRVHVGAEPLPDGARLGLRERRPVHHHAKSIGHGATLARSSLDASDRAS